MRNKLKDELAMNPGNETTINLIRGLSFAKVKMYPVEALEEWFRFLKELGNIYLTIREKDVRSAFAAMFVEILGPVAAVSLNVCLYGLCVAMLYSQLPTMSNAVQYCWSPKNWSVGLLASTVLLFMYCSLYTIESPCIRWYAVLLVKF